MKTMKILVDHLNSAFNLTGDLVQSLSDNDFKLKLDELPSNTIGEQLWCMVGARESYLKAMVNEGWSGFSCSLNDTTAKVEILQSLQKSADECLRFLNSHELNGTQTDLLITLLEHEIQHHGQLIRYVYGNKLGFPKSWHERYTV
jgi:uncharacterized damage-inducible protein DinB